MSINRKFFFDHVRRVRFTGSLTPKQVEGLDFILDVWEQEHAARDDRWLAYALATAYHETAFTMQPIREYGSDAYLIKMYSPQSADLRRAALAAKNGMRHNQDALDYCGRGYVQLTWRSNYIRMGAALDINLADNHQLAMMPVNAARIMFHGMQHGTFTGRKFADYFLNGKQDWINARRIINGLDCAEKIAIYAKDFYAALSYTT